MWRDLERLCAAYGVPLRRPSVFPRNGLLAARVACAAADQPWLPEFVRAVYRANFADDRNIADAAVLGDILAALGQQADALLAAAQTPETKQRLRADTDEAIHRGASRRAELYRRRRGLWGNDRPEAAIARHGR
jgi:2-hydroxychromene-2-carboxylate isomerase